MVAKFMGDDVRLREVCGAPAEPPQVLPEPEVDVDLLIRGTVERPCRCLRGATTRVGRIAKEHQFRVTILLTLLCKNLRPLLLHIVEHDRDQVRIAVLSGGVTLW